MLKFNFLAKTYYDDSFGLDNLKKTWLLAFAISTKVNMENCYFFFFFFLLVVNILLFKT